eukprot:Rmarinus@m.7823
MEYNYLHERPDVTPQVVEVLQAEWPRSASCWENSLNQSTPEKPCIVLFHEGVVVGFSRLHGTPVDGRNGIVCVDVVVRADHRGRGFGRKLMQHTETEAKKIGYESIFLSTKDQVSFYEHLGYEKCDDVAVVGTAGKALSAAQVNNLSALFARKSPSTDSASTSHSQSQWLTKSFR